MGILDIFFGKEEKKEEENLPPQVDNISLNNESACPVCNQPLEEWQKTKKFDKKRYHNKCLKKMMRKARRMQFS